MFWYTDRFFGWVQKKRFRFAPLQLPFSFSFSLYLRLGSFELKRVGLGHLNVEAARELRTHKNLNTEAGQAQQTRKKRKKEGSGFEIGEREKERYDKISTSSSSLRLSVV